MEIGLAFRARAAYLDAARRTGSEPERRYLEERAARLGDGRPGVVVPDPGGP